MIPSQILNVRLRRFQLDQTQMKRSANIMIFLKLRITTITIFSQPKVAGAIKDLFAKRKKNQRSLKMILKMKL